MTEPGLTVFTSTYNRKSLLKRAYDALLIQTCRDFIWLIVDDGSTDGTNEMVQQWTEENKEFQIVYLWKENGGFYSTYMTAIKYCSTELIVGVDSDDWMPQDGVETILKFWKEKGSTAYGGIIGLDYTADGSMIGDLLPELEHINLIGLLTGRYKLHNGDRTHVVRTELYREALKQPFFQSGKCFEPHMLYLEISRKYDFLVLNHCLKTVEYQEGGLTATTGQRYVSNPDNFLEMRKYYITLPDTSLAFKFRTAVHFTAEAFLAHRSGEIFCSGFGCYAILAYIPGLLLNFCLRFRFDSPKK